MDLPNRHLAYVPQEKITRYLLNLNHPKGWGKAQEFRKRGYHESNADALIRDLIEVARNWPVSEVEPTQYGTKYIIYGVIQPPMGAGLLILSVWQIDHGYSAPRLLSAYPQEPERIEGHD